MNNGVRASHAAGFFWAIWLFSHVVPVGNWHSRLRHTTNRRTRTAAVFDDVRQFSPLPENGRHPQRTSGRHPPRVAPREGRRVRRGPNESTNNRYYDKLLGDTPAAGV